MLYIYIYICIYICECMYMFTNCNMCLTFVTCNVCGFGAICCSVHSAYANFMLLMYIMPVMYVFVECNLCMMCSMYNMPRRFIVCKISHSTLCTCACTYRGIGMCRSTCLCLYMWCLCIYAGMCMRTFSTAVSNDTIFRRDKQAHVLDGPPNTLKTLKPLHP